MRTQRQQGGSGLIVFQIAKIVTIDGHFRCVLLGSGVAKFPRTPWRTTPLSSRRTRVSPGIGRLRGALRSGVGPSARTSAEPTANTPALIASTPTNAAAAMCHFLIVGIEKFKAGLL